MNSYWKRQVPMFYPLGETQKNLMGGGGGAPFLHIRGLSKFNMKTYLNINVFQGFSQEEI